MLLKGIPSEEASTGLRNGKYSVLNKTRRFKVLGAILTNPVTSLTCLIAVAFVCNTSRVFFFIYFFVLFCLFVCFVFALHC